jgi:predicted nucleic acid-binding protein
MSALIDTSVFIGMEAGRSVARVPEAGAVSAMTLAELHLGVLAARSPRARAKRLGTVSWVENVFDPIAFDEVVARRFAEVMVSAGHGGRKLLVADAVIAATALTHDLDLYTQDADFDGVPGLRVVKI